MEDNFPGGADTVPFHSRWRHFEAGGVDRVKALVEGAWSSVDPIERARRMIDLAVVCVMRFAALAGCWHAGLCGLGVIARCVECLLRRAFCLTLALETHGSILKHQLELH